MAGLSVPHAQCSVIACSDEAVTARAEGGSRAEDAPGIACAVSMSLRVSKVLTAAEYNCCSNVFGESAFAASSSCKALASLPGLLPSKMPSASATSRTPVAWRNRSCA